MRTVVSTELALFLTCLQKSVFLRAVFAGFGQGCFIPGKNLENPPWEKPLYPGFCQISEKNP